MPSDDSAYVLDGRVVTMNAAFDVLDSGRVYVRDERIEAVLPADAPGPEAFSDAPVVKTGGTIYPGLIELHNHLPYNVLPLWQVSRRYTNRGQWGGGNQDYRARISGPMGVLGRVEGYIEAVVRYVEAKCLLGGVTTSQGIALYSNAGARRYYHGVVRNVEQPGAADLPAADTRIADVEAANAAGFLERLRRSSCLLLHLSEGVDDVARSHFQALRVEGRSWAITNSLAGIHCAGLRGRDFATLRSRGGTMVWSPLSNLLLYGESADVARAVRERVEIALGSDWSPSGSKNLLGEMKVAWVVAQDRDAGLSARDIVAMATTNPARALKWSHALGSLDVGKRADLLVVHGRAEDPYEHLLRARETAIILVVIDGKPRYGQPRLMERFVADGNAEALQVGGSARVLDLHDAADDPIVGALSLGEARDRLADGLQRLPELARQMEQVAGGLHVGTTSAADDGTWFLELDHEPMAGFSPRPHLPLDGIPTGFMDELFVAGPLSEVVQPVALDPLTLADDGVYLDRLAMSPNLPEVVLAELPPLYGEHPRARYPHAAVTTVAAAEGSAGPVRLADVLDRSASTLKAADRELLVEQAMVLLGETYVHLELKRAMHAVEPLQRLRLLRYRLSQAEGLALSDLEFHNEMSEIFASVRDLHTNYLLPTPYRERTAFLPFRVEECFTDADPRYLVTGMVDGFDHPTFAPGVEVVAWNGVPVERAIALNGRLQGGSNRAAAFARGLDALTIRPLVRSLPPDDDWVVVTFRTADGVQRDVRWDWLVWAPPSGMGVDPNAAVTAGQTTALGYDIGTDAVTHARKVLYAPHAFAMEQSLDAVTPQPVMIRANDLPTAMPTVLRAREVVTAVGTFAYVRIFTFNVADADAFVAEFVRLVQALPAEGLIVDVRGNGGGLIYAAERLLQVLTPQTIEPSKAQFVTTPLMVSLAERHAPSPLDPTFDLTPWVTSMRQAVTTGAVHSQGQPITERESANLLGQRYQGPVVLVTDALCYSATDMFAAGFRDHEIGKILGMADNTGAGGANVWTQELLRALMDVPHPQEGTSRNPFKPLPHGAGMRVSVRRTTRVGALEGTPLEDLGVEPDERHHTTRDDLLHGNRDLIEHAGGMLAQAPRHSLDFDLTVLIDGDLKLDVRPHNIDRVDVWIDRRPVDTFDCGEEPSTRQVRPPNPECVDIDLRGHLGGAPVARAARKIQG